MDNNKKCWRHEDRLYYPKRKVNNRISKNYPHIIGSFYSNKMDKVVEYESLSECIFCFLMELDTEVLRYYVQPVEIEIPYIDKEMNRKHWIHVPDVLVFRKDDMNYLFQIKEQGKEFSIKDDIINRNAEKYSISKGWIYSVVKPKMLSDVLIKNINFLTSFTKKRKYYDMKISDIIFKLKFMKETTIEELAESFYNMSSLEIKPIIYYLIATGTFITNLEKPINELSVIKINTSENSFLNELFLLEEGNNAV